MCFREEFCSVGGSVLEGVPDRTWHHVCECLPDEGRYFFCVNI